jgi:hypothetical protein
MDFFPLPNVLTLIPPMSVHGASYVRRTEIQTAEPLVPEPSAFEIEVAIEKQSPGIEQIPAEFIKAGVRTIRCECHKLINSSWNKKELPEWKQSIIVLYLSVRRGIKQTVVIIEAFHFSNYV